MLSKMMVAGSNRRIHTVDRHAGMVRISVFTHSPRVLRHSEARSLKKSSFPAYPAGHLRPPTRRQAARQLGGGRGYELDQVCVVGRVEALSLFGSAGSKACTDNAFARLVSQHIRGQDTRTSARRPRRFRCAHIHAVLVCEVRRACSSAGRTSSVPESYSCRGASAAAKGSRARYDAAVLCFRVLISREPAARTA